jgi:hypothetical protein
MTKRNLKAGGSDIDAEIEELKGRVAALEEVSHEHDTAIGDLDSRVDALEGSEPIPPDPEPEPEPPPVGSTEIPVIPWTAVPGDWTNVKSYGAKGDGVNDDTAAIQRALNELTCFSGNKATIYIPAGRYKITSTLLQNYKEGSAVIGHGRDTILEWHGADNGCIFNCDSNAFSTFEGLVFDGRGKAANGLKHGNTQRREIMVMHRHLHFKDFRGEAIYIPDGKPDQKYVAESVFDNILIERCAVGITFIQHNDYINTVCGCVFLDCGIGIKSHYGLPLVRNCHFERSREADMTITGISHGRTIRRCTSQGSKMFVRLGDSAGWKNALNLIIEDVHVEGWTNVDGAIISYFRGPIVIYDSSFTEPPANARQTILLANTADYNQRLVWSNCMTEADPFVNKGPNGTVMEVPAGARGANLDDPSQSFLKGGTLPVPERIFAITSFGGSTGSSDNGPALQQAIDAAKAQGGNSWAYLPPGEWNISTTAVAEGGGFVVSGAGWKTKLWWRGAPQGGVMIRVRAPKDLTVQKMSLGHDDHGKTYWSIHQQSDGTPSRVVYDDLHFRKDFIVCGCFLDGLGSNDEVLIPFAQGRVWAKNSSRAKVLIGHMDYCSFVLEGAGESTGLFGIQSGFTPGSEPNIQVNDNLSLVASDLYSEASKTYISAKGNTGEGRITTCAPRMNTAQGQIDISVENYQGTISIFGSPFDAFGGSAGPYYKVKQTGARKVNIVYVGNAYLTDPNVPGTPQFEFTNGAATVAGCIVDSWSGAPTFNTSVPDAIPADGMQQIAKALDHFRELGALDLKLNYQWEDAG